MNVSFVLYVESLIFFFSSFWLYDPEYLLLIKICNFAPPLYYQNQANVEPMDL